MRQVQIFPMWKRILLVSLIFVLLYTGLIQFQVFRGRLSGQNQHGQGEQKEPGHKVYSFSFSKFSTDGAKEIEIEGDSANILAQTVDLMNVVAKAYAQEVPVTITADEGYYDKSKAKVHFEKNVVATTEDGARLLTEELDIMPETRIMETDVAATVKKDNIDIDGMGAKGDSHLKKVKFKKNVKVVIQNREGDFSSDTPTVITCDGPLVIDYHKNIAHFRDNVVSEDKRGRLFADKMDVYYDKEQRGVYKIIAMDNVIIENPDGNRTYSDHVIYLAKEGRVILGGDAEGLYYGGDKAELPEGW